MKKSTDIILRVIIVGAILGAIGYYYYNRFTKPMLPAIKSPIMKLPKPVVLPPPKPKHEKEDFAKTKESDNKTIAKTYTILIDDIISSKIFNDIINFLKNKNFIFETTTADKKITFKRVLIGPINNRTELIKKENILKNLNIEIMRLRIKRKYYIHAGSFAKDEKLKEFINFLNQHKFSNIKLAEVKIPKKVFSVKITSQKVESIYELEKFLNDLKIDYNLSESNLEKNHS